MGTRLRGDGQIVGVKMVGRDAKGRYIKGHKSTGGRKRRVAEDDMLARFRAAVSEADIEAVIEALVIKAKKGNLAATKLLFAYLLGLPHQSVEVEADVRTDVVYSAALERVYRAGE